MPKTSQTLDEAVAEERPVKAVERLSVNLSPEVAAILRAMAERQQLTVTEIVRRAILTLDFLDEKVREGYAVQLRKDGEPLKEIIFQ